MLTKYHFDGITSFTEYDNGNIKDIKFDKPNRVLTCVGELTPQFSGPNERRKDNQSLSFYPNGILKSIALEERTPIETPMGLIKAEFITFHEDQSLNSVFPTNGQISFGWSLADETNITEKYDFTLPFGKFSARIIALRFYESGALRSLILWPDEIVKINTPLGEIDIRIGFKLDPSGNLESFEPAYPMALETPIGPVTAFDYAALGVDADFNSIRFDPTGKLCGLYTNSDFVVKNIHTGERTRIFQHLRRDMLSDNFLKVPTILTFDQSYIHFDNHENKYSFRIDDLQCLILYDGHYESKNCTPSECSECVGC